DTLSGWPFERTGPFEWDWAPAVDVVEHDDKMVVKAELPGMTEKDVDISVEENVLTIKGEKKTEEEKKEKSYHRLERSYGMFQRSFILPTWVTPDKAKASFKDGVLEIELPKSEEVKPKQVKIKAA
ncbi:MAG: Hsp20/alpha crystallin family protein, partial [Candidatus Hydrogenedentota bacterium]